MFFRLVCIFYFFLMSNFLYAFPSNSLYNFKSELIDYTGKHLNISDLSGKNQIFSMIYTRCKTICPIIISNMKAIEKLLPDDVLSSVNFSLVSLDPDRDSVDVLFNFFSDKKFNSARWNLYKTNKDETLKIALAVGIKYKKEKNDEYTHSNLIILLDKNGVIKYHHPGLDKNYDNFIKIISSLK